MDKESLVASPKLALHAGPVIVLGFAASIVFIILAVWHINWSQVVQVLQMAIWYPWLLLGIASYLLGQIVRGARLKLLVTADATLNLATASNIVVVGYAVNNIAPARLGEFVRAALLAERTGFPYMRSLAVTFLERLFDGLAILLLLVVAACFVSLQSWIHQVALVAAVVLGFAVLLVCLAVLSPQLLISITSSITSGLPAAWHNRALALTTQACWGLRSLESPQLAGKIFVLSLLVWMLESGLYYFCLPCVGLSFMPALALITMAVTNLAILLPSSPGFIGPFHYFCMQTLVSFGISPELALSYALIVHLGFYLPVTLWGAAAMARYGIELGATAWWRNQAQHLPAVAASELPLQVITSGSSEKRAEPDVSQFWNLVCEAIIFLSPPSLDAQSRKQVVSEVSIFLCRQIDSLPWRLRLLLRLGMLGFQALVLVAYLRPFNSLPLDKRAAIVKAWAWGPLALTRQLFRPIRSLVIYAYLESWIVRQALDREIELQRRLSNAGE